MTPRGYTRAVALFLLSTSSLSLCAGQATDDWLRSSGKDLQICLNGQVFEADGRAATAFQITGSLNALGSNRPFE